MAGERGARILVVGFGNPLMADDGAGPEVVRQLSMAPLPAGVRVEDGGSDALRLPSIWRGEAQVWLVDAVVGRGEVGDVIRLHHGEVLAVPQRHATAHTLSLPESLRWIGIAYPEMSGVRYRMWGIVAAEVSLRSGLSADVASAAARVAGEIRDEMQAPTRDRRRHPPRAE